MLQKFKKISSQNLVTPHISMNNNIVIIFFFLYIFFQIFYIFYNTIFIPAVIQGWARPRWVVTPAPVLHGGEGWLGENRTQDGNQQSPGENRTRDWTSTVQRANHWATLHPIIWKILFTKEFWNIIFLQWNVMNIIYIEIPRNSTLI
jgi:hypothetical protein